MEMSGKTDQDRRVIPPSGRNEPKQERDLDEALYDSFPASDPVSATQKGEPTSPPRETDAGNAKPSADKMKSR
jgi:hypothetical protein